MYQATSVSSLRSVVISMSKNCYSVQMSNKTIQQIKDWLRNNVDSPDETPEGLSQDSLNLLNKIEEWEEENEK